MDMVVFSDVTASGGRKARYSCQEGSGWRVLPEQIDSPALISKSFPLARNSQASLRCPRALKFRHFSLIRYPGGNPEINRIRIRGMESRSLLFGSNKVGGDKNVNRHILQISRLKYVEGYFCYRGKKSARLPGLFSLCSSLLPGYQHMPRN